MLASLAVWPRAFGAWLWEKKTIWAALGVVIVPLFLIYCFSPTEQFIRLAGLAFQWLGIITVIVGIDKTRQLFSRPTLLKSFIGWLKRVPRMRHHKAAGALQGSGAILMSGTVRPKKWHDVPPRATSEQRLTILEANARLLDSRIDEAFKELEQANSAQAEALSQERSARTAEDEKLHSKLDSSATGGLDISAVGAWWLLVGVFLSTAARELECMLK